MKLKIYTILAALISCTAAYAAIPAGYYNKAQGKTGKALLQALETVISSHKNVGYDGLWEVYHDSDLRDDGSIWDMYSDKDWGKNWESYINKQYKAVGDALNREHSVPQSWFGSASPMKSDAFHVYPTDGYVNNQRGNYPFGECENGEVKTNGNVHGLGRLGSCTYPGYTGKVFEPDDQYKGDFARTYFYMAACYNSKIKNWSSPCLAGNNYPCYTSWAVDMFLDWARQDKVSSKEINRNEGVYKHQHNRNPFIDHPELAEYIWGDKVGTAWYPDNSGEDPDNP
ncbi:MAG: endonuclease, partial [Muribaculaceae bacterium]